MKSFDQTSTCPECGLELDQRAVRGLCPRCLIAGGVALREVPGASSAPPPEIDDIASLFPGFQVTKLIGRGGMGAVYLAQQLSLNRPVAIKILFHRDADEADFVERFRLEAMALAKLSHPNIVSVYDFGEREDFVFIVMEYVEGSDLAQLIASDSLTPPEALSFVVQICQALQYAHDNGIVHRDIKPANILIDTSGKVRIADFGLAKMLDSRDEQDVNTKDGHVGTPNYVAPEQRSSSGDADHRADIYSLGVVFHEMLTGKLPSGAGPLPSQVSEVDDRVDEVVQKSMESEPSLRYQQAREVLTEVEAIRASPEFKKRAALRNVVASGLLLLVGCGVVAAAVGWYHWDQERLKSYENGGLRFDSQGADTFIRREKERAADYFGREIAVGSDLLAIGSPRGFLPTKVYGNGSVEILRQKGDAWHSEATISCPRPDRADLFGSAIVFSAGQVLIGSPGLAGKNGEVFVYQADKSGEWSLVQTIVATNSRRGGAFGSRLAVDGSLLAIGSWSEMAYLFRCNESGLWDFVGSLEADTTGFGRSVAVKDDLVAVGANERRQGGGKAYIYRVSGEETELLDTLLPPDRFRHRVDFGHQVALVADRLLVSSHRATVGRNAYHGFVSSFRRDGDRWQVEEVIVTDDPHSQKYFGIGMVGTEDSLFVSAVAGVRRGLVYEYGPLSEGGWQLKQVHRRAPHLPDFSQKFGVGLAASADWLAVGYQDHPQASVRAGAVSVIRRK